MLRDESHVRCGRFEKIAVMLWGSDVNWKVQLLTAGAEVFAGKCIFKRNSLYFSPEAIHLAN